VKYDINTQVYGKGRVTDGPFIETVTADTVDLACQSVRELHKDKGTVVIRGVENSPDQTPDQPDKPKRGRPPMNKDAD
jgi:hypothetical protein